MPISLVVLIRKSSICCLAWVYLHQKYLKRVHINHKVQAKMTPIQAFLIYMVSESFSVCIDILPDFFFHFWVLKIILADLVAAEACPKRRQFLMANQLGMNWSESCPKTACDSSDTKRSKSPKWHDLFQLPISNLFFVFLIILLIIDEKSATARRPFLRLDD